ncbi:hypothetical protein AX14_013541 [Amanita brunnescens Koide BX004]|nr:hypothetical protein AX14_013541 [Amanita brunnescens Koide BX004]
MSFKESTQVNPACWFFITCAVLQASLALICSTVTIVLFSGDHHIYEYSSADENRLRFLSWSIWDHNALPAVTTAWGTFTFVIALIVDAVRPLTVQNNRIGQVDDFTMAKILLSLALCFTAARFGIFMLHLRRISQALLRAESA